MHSLDPVDDATAAAHFLSLPFFLGRLVDGSSGGRPGRVEPGVRGEKIWIEACLAAVPYVRDDTIAFVSP